MDPTAPARRRTASLLALPVLVALVAMACGAGDNATDQSVEPTSTSVSAPPTTEAAPAPTTTEAPTTSMSTTTAPVDPIAYDGDFGASVVPVLAEKCASCHAPGGPGTAHWVLGDVADVTENRQAIIEVIEEGLMPPWPAGGASPAFAGDRSLRDDQLQTLLDWHADGGPVDVDAATPIEPVNGIVGLENPDQTLTPAEPYGGSLASTDDYRCQIYDPELPDGGWITAYEFLPDQTEVVHHAIGYLIPADRRARAEARDGEDGKPGWSCYGSSGLGQDEIFLGWAPGQDPSAFPEGSGLWVEPGAFIVVQIHYHYETDAPADASALALKLADGGELDPIQVSSLVAPAEIPCAADESGPLCDRDAALAAAEAKYGDEGVLADETLRICRASVEDFASMTDGIASSRCDIPALLVGAVGEVVSVLGHQHEIGAWFRMTVNPGKPDERVLLDIPKWDFDWQYNYIPAQPIVIDADDLIRIECGWNRAFRDPRLEPAYVLWADGTDDEMCFATITTRPPAS